MRRWMFAAGLAAALVPGSAFPAVQTGPQVVVRAYRVYRAAQKQTEVTALVEVPYTLLESPSGNTGELRYSVAVNITDQSGTKLYGTAWPGRARADQQKEGVTKLDVITFAVAPGKYTVTVTVIDSVAKPNREFSGSAQVEGWDGAPPVSDLMLSPLVRLVSPTDTAKPKANEVLRGDAMVTPTTLLRLSPVFSKAFYFLEAYSETRDSGTMQVKVIDSAGRALVRTPPTPVQVAPGGSLLKGGLDLGGLPAGTYTLAVDVNLNGTQVERSDRLVMSGPEEMPVVQDLVSDAGFFGAMASEQLDEAAAPLGYLAPPDSLSVYKQGLSLEAKRRFLTQFWEFRDPSPGTPKNESREQFYRLITLANERFSEGGKSKTPGWKTDRGRVFVRYGDPSEQLDRRTSLGKAPPYQVWRYERGKMLYYIFADRSGFGAYKLLASNDIRETQKPGYEEILGGEALQDISRWLGIDLFRTDAASVQP